MGADADVFTVARSMIFVRGLRVEAQVGVHVHERGGTQPLVVDVEIDVPMPARDDINSTFDYVTAAEAVRRTARSRHFDLIETFAQEVGRMFLEIEEVRQVFVRVTKPSALAGSADATGVELLMGHDRP